MSRFVNSLKIPKKIPKLLITMTFQIMKSDGSMSFAEVQVFFFLNFLSTQMDFNCTELKHWHFFQSMPLHILISLGHPHSPFGGVHLMLLSESLM